MTIIEIEAFIVSTNSLRTVEICTTDNLNVFFIFSIVLIIYINGMNKH